MKSELVFIAILICVCIILLLRVFYLKAALIKEKKSKKIIKNNLNESKILIKKLQTELKNSLDVIEILKDKDENERAK